jgi:hypothetical protein
MTSEERTKYARSLQRWLRDQDVAAGRRAPKNMRETGIWLEGMRERDAAMDQLIADAEPDRHAPGADAEGEPQLRATSVGRCLSLRLCPAPTAPQVIDGKPIRSGGPLAARAPDAARQHT